MKRSDGTCRASIGNFVDLGFVDDENNNNNKINQSTSTFYQTLSMITHGNKDEAPYKFSPLTRLLQDSIGGNCKTAFILTVTPEIKKHDSTIASFEFGKKIKSIKNEPKQNVEIPNALLNKYLDKKTNEIEKLLNEQQTLKSNIHQLQNEVIGLKKIL